MFEIKEIVSYTWGFLFFSITKQNEKSFVFSCRQPVHSLLADSSQFVTVRHREEGRSRFGEQQQQKINYFGNQHLTALHLFYLLEEIETVF